MVNWLQSQVMFRHAHRYMHLYELGLFFMIYSIRLEDANSNHLVHATDTNNASQDYYAILGVPKDATKKDIQKRFRELAKKYHPDRNKDKDAPERFMEIFKAYETLSDDEKRREYDSASHSSDYRHQSSNLNDFDMNGFFQSFDSYWQHHGNHHHHDHGNYHKFTFGGVNLEDLFHNIDEEEFASFRQFFGHRNVHQHHHQQQHFQANSHHDSDGFFGDGLSYFGSFGQHPEHHHQQHYHQASSYSCRTVTTHMNGMTVTQTQCA